MYEPVVYFVTGLTSAATLMLLHVTLWPLRRQMPRVASYVIGCSGVGVGLAAGCAVAEDWRALALYAAALVPGGAVIGLAWLVRLRGTLQAEAAADADAIAQLARRERTY